MTFAAVANVPRLAREASEKRLPGMAAKRLQAEAHAKRPPRIAARTNPSGARTLGLAESKLVEVARWEEFLSSLDTLVRSGRLTDGQARALRDLAAAWTKLVPTARIPAAGQAPDGSYFVSWSYTDRVGESLGLEIEPDGHVHWHYRHRDTGIVEGSEDEPLDVLPDTFYRYLHRFSR